MSFQCFHLNCSCNIFAQKGLRKTTLVEEKEKKIIVWSYFNVSCGNTGDEFCWYSY
uniref:Uncharacterized protein n=1 Tax=Phocoena sinus TaxID=42100 RepID=A0A8C9AU07_PHOSS